MILDIIIPQFFEKSIVKIKIIPIFFNFHDLDKTATITIQ